MWWCRASALTVALAASTACGDVSKSSQPPAETDADRSLPPRQLQAIEPLPAWRDGTWRVARAIVAPWAIADSANWPNTRQLIGATIRFYDGTVGGPPAAACDNATHVLVDVPATGMFSGKLPDSASAVTLGVGAFPVETVRVTCSSGVFDYHRVDSMSMLVALDNAVYTLVQSELSGMPGTHPAGVVQALLESHFADGMSFDRVSMGRGQHWLSPTLWLDLQAYLSRPVSADEPPTVKGDPFTNLQEYPTRFVVTGLEEAPTESRVTVQFRDAYSTSRSTFVLQRVQEEWRVHDIVFEDGTTLRQALQPA